MTGGTLFSMKCFRIVSEGFPNIFYCFLGIIKVVGSHHDSNLAHGEGFITSGGATPKFKHSTNIALMVFCRSFMTFQSDIG